VRWNIQRESTGVYQCLANPWFGRLSGAKYPNQTKQPSFLFNIINEGVVFIIDLKQTVIYRGESQYDEGAASIQANVRFRDIPGQTWGGIYLCRSDKENGVFGVFRVFFSR
jgi:hypothetical protein